MGKTKRAAVYCRISRDRTGTQAGTRRQEHECRDLVERHDWQLTEVFTDDDTSAYTGRPRPAYQALLEAVEAGQVDVVVAWHPDRLTRSPRELEDLIDTLEAGHCQVETVRAGRVDLGTRSGRTTARLIGAVARDESEAKAERLKAMHADRTRRGLWWGGPRPYGYQPTEGGSLVIVEAEATVIREAAQRVIAGEWVGQIASDLNQRGVPTARTGRWRVQTLRRMLTSPVVVGRRTETVQAAWPGILDDPTWHQCRARILDPKRARGTVARVSLLAGVAVCSKCGTHLITQRRQNGARVYVCPARTRGGCAAVQIVADPLDDLVRDRLLDELDRPEFLAELAGDDQGRRDELDSALAAVEQRRAELAKAMATGDQSVQSWLAATRALDDEEARLLTELAAIPGPTETIDPALIREGWGAMSLAEKRAVLGMFVETVVVDPTTRRGPGFDPGRVDPETGIVWRRP